MFFNKTNHRVKLKVKLLRITHLKLENKTRGNKLKVAEEKENGMQLARV